MSGKHALNGVFTLCGWGHASHALVIGSIGNDMVGAHGISISSWNENEEAVNNRTFSTAFPNYRPDGH